MQTLAKALEAIPGVEAEVYYRKIGNEVPHVAVRWDQRAFGLTKAQCVDALRSGDPHIEVIGGTLRELVHPEEGGPVSLSGAPGEPKRLIAIASNTLQAGEEKIIARRLREILEPAAQRAQRKTAVARPRGRMAPASSKAALRA